MRRRGIVTGLWVAAVTVGIVVGFAAGRATLTAPVTSDPDRPDLTYAVQDGQLGRSIQAVAEAKWSTVPLGTGSAEGTVTSILVTPGTEVRQGSLLYSVDLRPVSIAQGAVPSFRDLSLGDRGDDVHQLQVMLRDLGHLSSVPKGNEFGASTATAVEKWQQALKLDPDGVVRKGDLVYTESLPTRVVLDEELSVGDATEANTIVAYALVGDPQFAVKIAAEQGSMLPESPEVRVKIGDRSFDATVALTEAVSDESQGSSRDVILLHLSTPDGGSVCAESCELVPIGREAVAYSAEIVIVPNVSGPLVPTAAIQADADGSTFVIDAKTRRQIAITVTASASGQAIVAGIEVGHQILLFGEDASDVVPKGS